MASCRMRGRSEAHRQPPVPVRLSTPIVRRIPRHRRAEREHPAGQCPLRAAAGGHRLPDHALRRPSGRSRTRTRRPAEGPQRHSHPRRRRANRSRSTARSCATGSSAWTETATRLKRALAHDRPPERGRELHPQPGQLWRRAAGSWAATCRASASTPGQAYRSRERTEAWRERASSIGVEVPCFASCVRALWRSRCSVQPSRSRSLCPCRKPRSRSGL